MARPLRLEFPGAIYHAYARGNNRQRIYLTEDDRREYTSRLAETVNRFDWEMLSFVQMTNHVHHLFCTPQPNLSKGMQYLLSGYANYFQRRHGRTGHVFQGRFKGELIEDESYYWAVSRYIHLNPLRVATPLVDNLMDWPWSSFPGFADPGRRLEWVSYEKVLQSWQGGFGSSAMSSYLDFVADGITSPPENPFANAVDGWILGTDKFVDKLKSILEIPSDVANLPKAKRLLHMDLPDLLRRVTEFYGVTEAQVLRRRGRHSARAVFVWLARRHTSATRRELAHFLGLSHPDSVSSLIAKVNRHLTPTSPIHHDIQELSRRLRLPQREAVTSARTTQSPAGKIAMVTAPHSHHE